MTEVDMEEKRTAMIARMEARQAERTQTKGQPSENQQAIEDFLKKLEVSKTEMGLLLEAARTVAKEELPAHFASMIPMMEAMQRSTAESAFFLPLYELRQAKLAATALQKNIDTLKAELIPKKRFAFRSRNKKKKEEAKVVPEVQVEAETTVEEKAAKDAADVAAVNDALASCMTEERPILTIEKREKEVIYKAPGSVNGCDVVLSDLSDCVISIADASTALRIHRLKRCTVIVGPVSGSVLLVDAVDCTFVIACRQLRTHENTNCDFYLGVMSKPIIEHCNGVRVAPYNLHYPELEQQLIAGGLKDCRENGLWADIQDFNWLRQQHSPNWSEIEPAARVDQHLPREI